MRYLRYTPIGFAENTGQWHKLNTYRETVCPDLQIVAVTPEVDYLALCGGQPYLSIEDFYYWDQINILGQENFDIAEQICDEVDKVLRRAMDKMPGAELVSFGALFHPLKGFLDSVTLRMAPVEAVFRYIQPGRVVCFEQPEYKIAGANLLDKPSLSLTNRLAALVAGAQNRKIDWLKDENAADRGEKTVCVQQADTVNDAAEMKSLFDAKIKTLVEILKTYQSRLQLHSGKPALFSNEGLDNFTARILNRWKNDHNGAVYDISLLYTARPGRDPKITEGVLNEIGQLLWNVVEQSPAIRQMLTMRGVDVYPLVRPLLSLLITKELPRLFFQAAVTECHFRSLKNAIVMTGGMMDINSVIGKACNKFGIPMVSTHRGGFLGYCITPFHERYEFADADYYLSGGPGAAETFAKPSPMARWRPARKRAKPIVTGLGWIDELVASNRKPKIASGKNPAAGRRRIMYVMSAMLGDNCYLGYIFHPEIWLWRFQLSLIRFLAGFSDIDVILKPPMTGRYPQIKNPIFDWLKIQNLKNIRVFEEDIALEKVMDSADAFIVDSPSTPIWPLVSSEKPFVAYIDRALFKVVPQAAEMLKKRAVFADNIDEFFGKLGGFLQKPKWTLDRPINDEFLRYYGTYMNDGNSDKRVAEVLFQLATGNCCRQSGEYNESYSRISQPVGG